MPKTSTVARSGLFTTDAVPVPLAGVAVDAEISTFCTRVSITQRYVNRETTPIEVVYVFPLDEGAAVCGFEAVIDGTLVVGEVKEREEAFRMYDDAMERGHGAFLLDEERPDVFQASVGNLPPGKEVLLKLTYVTELTVDGSGLRFVVPTTVSPRYAPEEDRRGVGRPDSETLNPPVAWRVPYGLNLSIQLAMTGAITRIESPSHPVSVSTDGVRSTVTLSQRETALDRDFVLSVEAAGLDTPRAWIEREDDGRETIAMAFVPTLPNRATPSEVIFVVDRSGSMDGTSIAEVRNALQLCLRSMIEGCRFNIIGFGDKHETLFETSQPYDERSLAAATEHVAALQANLGGTEVLPALTIALEGSGRIDGVRQIVLLTDGQVTNTDQVIALVKKHATHARVFTFGIGAGASQHLVNGIARAGGGTAEFIHPGERIEPKVVRQLGRLLSPALTNLCVDWGGLSVTQLPSVLPPVFAGGRMIVYGALKAADSAKPSTVRLTAETSSGPIAFAIDLDPATAVSGRTAATLAARARIRELEESPEWLASRGSRQSHRKTEAAAGEIVALATRYGLMSRHTSYVAVERRDTPVVGDVKLRRVPIALTSGWGGLEMPRVAPTFSLFGNRFGAARTPGGVEDAVAFSRASSLSSDHDQADSGDSLYVSRLMAGRAMKDTRSLLSARMPPPRMHALIMLQQADGSWDLTHDLADLMGRSLRDLTKALDGATGTPDVARRALATALALVWLKTHASDDEDQWGLLAGKAQAWLAGIPAAPARGRWLDAAQAVLWP